MRSPMPAQRGVALLVVMLILALMMVVAASISSRFQSSLLRSRNVVNMEQAKWYAIGSEALVAKVLNQDIKDSPTRTYLSQYWARENQVFPIGDSTLTGGIRDAQACFNLNAFATTDTTKLAYVTSVFKSLLGVVGVEDSQAEQVAASVADWVDSNDEMSSGYGAEDAWYQSLKVPYLAANQSMADVSELRTVRGVSSKVYRKLLPYVCTIPTTELAVNINTVKTGQAALLSALLLGKLSLQSAQELLAARPTDGWEDLVTFKSESAITSAMSGLSSDEKTAFSGAIVIKSSYFEARMKIELDDLQLAFTTLFKRQGSNKVVAIRRQFGGLE